MRPVFAMALVVIALAGLFAAGIALHGKSLPTMSDIEAMNHAAAGALDDAELERALRSFVPRIGDEELQAEIESVLGGARPREDAATRWIEGVRRSIGHSGVFFRHGTVEELWYAEGVLREFAVRRSASSSPSGWSS